MILIKAIYRYEVDGKTIIIISKQNLGADVVDALSTGAQVTYSVKNENSGVHERFLKRSIHRAVFWKRTPIGAEAHMELDYQTLPVSQSELDGVKSIQ